MENHKNIKKRPRSQNWLEEDKNLLMDLVSVRVSAIEDKNTDTNTNSKKLAAWTDLLNSFNSMCKGSKRTVSQVKSQWSIIKMTKKKLKSDERKTALQTGGSSPPSTKPEITPDIGTTSQVMNVIQEPLQEMENTQKAVSTDSSPFTSSSKKPKKKEDMSKASAAAAESIASMETACRKELHEVQMANEERRARNLDLEESLLKVKIDFFRKRIELLENYNK